MNDDDLMEQIRLGDEKAAEELIAQSRVRNAVKVWSRRLRT